MGYVSPLLTFVETWVTLLLNSFRFSIGWITIKYGGYWWLFMAIDGNWWKYVWLLMVIDGYWWLFMAIVLSCCLLNRRPKDPKNHLFFPTGLDSQGKLWVAVPWDFLVGGETAFSPSNPSNRNDHLIDYQDPKNWTKQSCPFGERLNKLLLSSTNQWEFGTSMEACHAGHVW